MAEQVTAGRRAFALLALAALVAAILAGLLALNHGGVWRLIVIAVVMAVTVVGLWYLVATRGTTRLSGGLAAGAGVIAFVLVALTAPHKGLLVLLALALAAVSAIAARRALRPPTTIGDRAAATDRVAPAGHPVLIMNPWSGGGKVEKFDLVEECRRRGIEPVVLSRGDDLLELAQRAIDSGADVIGMAGGDGSQALVASLASRHGIPHVCIPAGTRNHFALDLGLDRDNVVGALDAYGEAVERRIDLATVNGRVFVNNASMGVYAKIVQSPEYRDAKLKTAAAMLPDMLGPDAEQFDLRFTGPDGEEQPTAQMLLVSNDPYQLDHLDGRGTRARLDTGTLGVVAITIGGASEAVQLAGLESAGRVSQFPGWLEWETGRFRVESSAPVEIGVDGEALSLEPPLEFESHPGALRVRIPLHAAGASPAALRLPEARALVPALIAVAAGR